MNVDDDGLLFVLYILMMIIVVEFIFDVVCSVFVIVLVFMFGCWIVV